MKILPNPYLPTIQHAILKQTPQDFIVNEILSLNFSENGEHLWIKIRKMHLNTTFVAKLLAQWANIPIKDVGFSGLKDRHAITTQWFSLRIPNKQSPSIDFHQFIADKIQPNETLLILQQQWHNKKLNRGTHQANQFSLTLREIIGNKDEINQQLEQIKCQGVPNYFGEQRFGKEADNLEKVTELLKTNKINGKKIHPKFDRDKLSLYLSSARSALFNAILAKRITDKTWNTPLSGEVMNLNGSQSVFIAEKIDNEIIERLSNHDIHLTGAMWGTGELMSCSEVAQLEMSVVNQCEQYQLFAKGLERYGLRQQRRALRLIPQHLTWQWIDNHCLKLDFSLPKGSFATSVVSALINYTE